MNSVLATTLLGTLTVVNYCIAHRRILYPPFIFSSVWWFEAAIYSLSPIKVDQVHAETWWIVVLGAVCFSVGGWLTRLVPSGLYASRIRQLSHATVSGIGRKLLITVCAIGMILMLRELRNLAGSWNPVQMLAGAHASAVETSAETGQAATHMLGSAAVISIFTILLCAIEGKDKHFWTALWIATVSCILSTGRNYLLMLFTAATAVLMLKEHRDSLRSALRSMFVPIALFLIVFAALPFLVKDVTSFRGNIRNTIANFTIAYVMMPLAALDRVVTNPEWYAGAPHHTFQTFLKLLNALGYSFKIPPMLDEAVFVPLPTNVYTVYKFYLTDFGYAGMFVCIFLLGMFQTAVYRRALCGGRVSLVLSALLVYPTVISIFDDGYFPTGMTHIIAGTLLAVFYFGFLNRLGLWLPSLSFGERQAAYSASRLTVRSNAYDDRV